MAGEQLGYRVRARLGQRLCGWVPSWLSLTDPGRLRLAQGLKTVLAVLLTLALFYDAERMTLLMGGIAAGFLMQSAEGDDRRTQALSLLLSGAAMMVVVVLGAGLQPHWWVLQALSVVLAFLVFYVRRFVPRRAAYPIFVFVIYLLATVFPGGWHAAGQEAMAVTGALACTFAVSFLILPRNYPRAFVHCIEQYCEQAADLLRGQRERLAGLPASGCPDDLRSRMRVAILFNQELLPRLPVAQHDASEKLLIDQYEILQSLTLLHESIATLPAGLTAALAEAMAHLGAALDLLATRFDGLADYPAAPVSDAEWTGALERFQSCLLNPALKFEGRLTYLFSTFFCLRRLALFASRLEGNLAAAREGQAS